MFWRFGLAALLLAAYCVARGFAPADDTGRPARAVRDGRLHVLRRLPVIYYAEQHLVSGLVAVGYSASPLVNMLTSRLAFGTRMSRRVIVGGLLGLAGVVCVFWPEFMRIEADRGALLGAVFTAAGVLASALGNVFSSRAQRHGGNVWQKMAWAMGWGAGLAGAIALMKGDSFGAAGQPGLPHCPALSGDRRLDRHLRELPDAARNHRRGARRLYRCHRADRRAGDFVGVRALRLASAGLRRHRCSRWRATSSSCAARQTGSRHDSSPAPDPKS